MENRSLFLIPERHSLRWQLSGVIHNGRPVIHKIKSIATIACGNDPSYRSKGIATLDFGVQKARGVWLSGCWSQPAPFTYFVVASAGVNGFLPYMGYFKRGVTL